MKVLISGSFWHGSLEESYARAFERMGWKVIRFDWEEVERTHPLAKIVAIGKLLHWRLADHAGQILVTVVKETRPDLVLVIKGRSVHPEIIQKLASLIPSQMIVNFNPDSPWEPRNASKRILEAIPLYRAHFTWNDGLIDHYTRAGAQAAHFLPFAHDPALHYPIEAANPEFDAVFIGTYDEERDKLLSKLSGCKIGIWGNGWDRARYVPRDWVKGSAIYGEEATCILGSSICALNILRPQNRGGHNMRTFEIPATRHAMLATRSAMHERLFIEGKEAEFFDGVEELREKIAMLRQDPTHANEIAKNGYERVKDETYIQRVATMLDILGFSID